MVQLVIAAAVAFLVFGVLLAVLHPRVQNGSQTRSELGGCGRSVCRCRRRQSPGGGAWAAIAFRGLAGGGGVFPLRLPVT